MPPDSNAGLKAVTPLLGFVLMLAIIMGFIALLQSYAVPQWNKAVEIQHLDKISYEVAEIGSTIAISAATGGEGRVVIDGGVKYPSRPFLISPLQSSTTVSAVRLAVSVNGNTYNSYAIVVTPNYLYMQRPLLIYEHSAVFERSSGTVFTVNQSSFKPGRIDLYLINTTLTSISSPEPINLFFEPVSYGRPRHLDSITITFESYDNETARLWNETLNRIGYAAHRSGNSVQVTASDVYFSISEIYVYASSFGEIRSELKPSPVSLENLSTDQTVFAGTTVPLGVRVLDKYGNPVRGVDVDVTDSYRGITDTLISDGDGEVWYYFNAESSGTYTVTFSIPADSITYTITVNSPSGSGGGSCIFDAGWIESDFTWDVSKEGRDKTIHYYVYYKGNPVDGAKVNLAQTNSSVLRILNTDNIAATNSSGIANVYLNATSNGETSIIGMISSCADVINITVVNFTSNRPPTEPSLTTDKKRYYVGETIIATASGSTDPDGDPVTYYYKFYDYTDSRILQDWSTANTYTITSTEEGHVIRVYAKACDDKGACSAENYTDVGVIKVVTLYPTDDSYVDARLPFSNFGGSGNLKVECGVRFGGFPPRIIPFYARTYVKFDLSSIPHTAVVISADLKLYCRYVNSPLSRNYGAHRVLENWNEGSITWRNQPRISTNPSDTVQSGRGWKTWNVTHDVANMVSGSVPNYGWCIKDEQEFMFFIIYSLFYSKEGSATYKPRLIVEYSPI